MLSIFCGLSSFPFAGDASSNRYLAIADMWSKLGWRIVFVNKFALFSSNPSGVDFEYDLLAPSGFIRKSNFFARQLHKFCAYFNEFNAIRKYRAALNVSADCYLNVYTSSFIDLLFYRLIAWKIEAVPILHVVEIRSSFENRDFSSKVNDYLFELFQGRLYKKFMAISSPTADLVGMKGNDVLLVPPVCDFDWFANLNSAIELDVGGGVVYCASMAYEDVIYFVISSFERIIDRVPIDLKLILVIKGDLSERIKGALERLNGRALVLSNLQYDQLVAIYKSSSVLLMPLRPTLQDSARFPQKLCEYLASRRPIVTTSFGEVGVYLLDGVNAFVASDYDVDLFSSKLLEALTAVRLGEVTSVIDAAYATGKENFDISSNVTRLDEFICNR